LTLSLQMIMSQSVHIGCSLSYHAIQTHLDNHTVLPLLCIFFCSNNVV